MYKKNWMIFHENSWRTEDVTYLLEGGYMKKSMRSTTVKMVTLENAFLLSSSHENGRHG